MSHCSSKLNDVVFAAQNYNKCATLANLSGKRCIAGACARPFWGGSGVSGGVAVGIAWAGGRRGRRRAGGGWWLRPSACRATRCATAVFRPLVVRACKTAAAGVPNGPCGNLKRGLLPGLAAGWPPGAAVRRCAGGHPVGPWPPCAGVAEAPERRFCNFFAGGCKFFPKKFWRFGKSDYLCTRLQEARALSSAGLEHLPYKQRVGGSNPSAPTTEDSAPHPGWQNLFLCPGKFYRLFFG